MRGCSVLWGKVWKKARECWKNAQVREEATAMLWRLKRASLRTQDMDKDLQEEKVQGQVPGYPGNHGEAGVWAEAARGVLPNRLGCSNSTVAFTLTELRNIARLQKEGQHTLACPNRIPLEASWKYFYGKIKQKGRKGNYQTVIQKWLNNSHFYKWQTQENTILTGIPTNSAIKYYCS